MRFQCLVVIIADQFHKALAYCEVWVEDVLGAQPFIPYPLNITKMLFTKPVILELSRFSHILAPQPGPVADIFALFPAIPLLLDTAIQGFIRRHRIPTPLGGRIHCTENVNENY